MNSKSPFFSVSLAFAFLFIVVGSACNDSQSDSEKGNVTTDHEVDDRFISAQPPSESDDAALTSLPDGAEISSDEEAADQAVYLLKAEDPRILSVELLTLEAALVTSQELQNEDPELALAGRSPSELESLVWRVMLEASEISAPASCPPPAESDEDEPVPADHCGKLHTPAEMILDPEDGSWISATFVLSRMNEVHSAAS